MKMATSEIVTKYLEEMKASGKFDIEFIALLSDSNSKNEDGETTATKALEAIRKRYAKSKKDKN